MTTDIVKFVRMNDQVALPSFHYDGDAGFDLAVYEDVIIGSATSEGPKIVEIPTGIKIEMPNKYFARLTGRSSTMRHHKLMVVEGIIDAGYRGELTFAVINWFTRPVKLKAGDRIAQVIFHNRHADNINLIEATELSESSRGNKGFGSTGRF